jgi:hypothetical protein
VTESLPQTSEDAVLYHFSHDPNIEVFRPRPLPHRPEVEPFVWAIDEWHSFCYFFPRQCPRVVTWPLPETSDEDRLKFMGHTAAKAVAAIESSYAAHMYAAKLYAYSLPATSFEVNGPEIGVSVSREDVVPLAVKPIGNLVEALIAANVELRITPSLWPLWDDLVQSTMHYSMFRTNRASPRPG